MTEVIVMPTCKRPEMLALALRAIDRADNPPDDVRIFCDTNTDVEEVTYVRNQYLPHALIFHAAPHVDLPSGMWNILMALKAGYSTGADFVYLIEEDVVVNQSFFNWHRMWSDEVLATCGRLAKRRSKPGYYTNPGSCLRRHALDLIVPHINDELFADRQAYLNKHFPGSDELSDLDDGLIRRVQKKYGLEVVYPEQPECSHIGFGAYNHYMNWTNEGSIEERILRLRQMLMGINPNDRYTSDFEPIQGNWWSS